MLDKANYEYIINMLEMRIERLENVLKRVQKETVDKVKELSIVLYDNDSDIFWGNNWESIIENVKTLKEKIKIKNSL